MQLWTDYEGVTIDGAFRLQKLLMPEGRSAFFSTAGPHGEPTVVRLIECHFDEEEILARWRCLEALSHPNFLKFVHFGPTQLDGRPVVYAVFEEVDANLAEVLDQGHLTVEDVAQLASSLLAALDVLHTHGFVHEHIEPRNIFAVGSVVKLRGDCIREAPEGEEGRAAKQRDVHNLAAVLLQGLTQRESLDGTPDSAMPPPFGQIIRKGLDGTWTLENIRAALEARFGPMQPAASASVNAAPETTPVTSAAAKPSERSDAQLPLLNGNRSAGFDRITTRKDTWNHKDTRSHKDTRNHKDSRRDNRSFPLRSIWLAAGMVALLLLLSTWVFGHAWNAHHHKATQTAAISQPAAQSAKPVATNPVPTPVAAASSRLRPPASAGSHADWRVITFTYNHRKDAEKKAASIAHSHSDLNPQVFSPSGRAPYLVSIGGLMDRDAAHALVRRSRSMGLPRDIYAQNFSH